MATLNQQVTNGQVLKFLKEYWFIVVVIVSIAMTWATLTGKVSTNHKMNEAQEVEIRDNMASINQLNLKYTEDITFIKTSLEILTND